MDLPQPAVIAPLPDTADPALRPFASGSGPDWALSWSRDMLVLRLAGAAPLHLAAPRWTTTVDGRTLVARAPDGAVVMLREVHGRCPDGGEGMIAQLVIGQRHLIGCIHPSAERPYDSR